MCTFSRSRTGAGKKIRIMTRIQDDTSNPCCPVDQHLLFATWLPFSPEKEMSKLLHCSKGILPTLCRYNQQAFKA